MTEQESRAIDALELARARMISAHAALQLAYLNPTTPEADIDAIHAALADTDAAFTCAMLDLWNIQETEQAIVERETAAVH